MKRTAQKQLWGLRTGTSSKFTTSPNIDTPQCSTSSRQLTNLLYINLCSSPSAFYFHICWSASLSVDSIDAPALRAVSLFLSSLNGDLSQLQAISSSCLLRCSYFSHHTSSCFLLSPHSTFVLVVAQVMGQIQRFLLLLHLIPHRHVCFCALHTILTYSISNSWTNDSML